MSKRIFLTGGTGYIGSRLIPRLVAAGHHVKALTRESSRGKLPTGCEAVIGDALNGKSYESALRDCDTFVQLVGVPHPSPAKAKEFVAIDQKSGLDAIAAAAHSGIQHFVYVSVAHPAPTMHAYIAARSKCEDALQESGINATILRPWYVLGPGHYWPYALVPFYWLFERIPSKRESALRLGLVKLPQVLNALHYAVEHPVSGIKIMEVPEIRRAIP